MTAEAAFDYVRRTVMDGLRSRRPLPAILDDLSRELALVNTDEALRDLLANDIAKYERIAGQLTPAGRPAETADILRQAGSAFARTKEGIVRGVESVVLDALAKDRPLSEIEDRISGVIGTNRNYFRTIARTAGGAFERATRFADSVAGGFQYFTYSGPPAERGFCREHLGKTYSLEQIKKLDNGQQLDPVTYCGGWNCRHGWIPADPPPGAKQVEKATKPTAPIATAKDPKPKPKQDTSEEDAVRAAQTSPNHEEGLQIAEEAIGLPGSHRLRDLLKNADPSAPLRVYPTGEAEQLLGSAGFGYGSARIYDVSKLARASVAVHEIGHFVQQYHKVADRQITAFYIGDEVRAMAKAAEKRFGYLSRYRKDPEVRRKLDRGLYGERNSDGSLQAGSGNLAQVRRMAERHGLTEPDAAEIWQFMGDSVMSLTGGKAGFGHSPSYMKDAKRRYSELCAHAAEWKYLDGAEGDLLRTIVRKDLPDLADALDEFAAAYFDD